MKTQMDVSERFIHWLACEEGVRLEPYDDRTGKPWKPGQPIKGTITIGIGHAYDPNKEHFTVLTTEQAYALCRRDLRARVQAVNLYVTVELTQWEFDALVSFVFNVGLGRRMDPKDPLFVPGFINSTLLKLLNKGDKQGAARQLMRWIYSQGRPVLAGRRSREKLLFERAKYVR